MKKHISAGWLIVVFLAALIFASGPDRGPAALQSPPDRGPVAKTAAEPAEFSAVPLVAQAQISAVLGRDHSSYHAGAHGKGFRVENPNHGLVADFAPSGVQVRAGTANWSLALRGYGYGDALQGAMEVAPQAVANRVEYRRGALTEWYLNGPVGLEQGFTLARPPGENTGEPLTLAFNLSGNLTASADSTGKGAILSRADGKPALRYRGLTAHDATGRELWAWLQVEEEQLRLRVDDTGAQYPLVVDPFIEEAKLTASDATEGDFFGISVSVSGDTIVVGAWREDIGSNTDQGSAYVFVKPAGGWSGALTENAKLTASDGAAGDGFGISVSVSGDTIVAGASSDDIGSNTDQGSAYVFVKPVGGWSGALTEDAKLTASDATGGDFFGISVSVSGDTIVVGAWRDDIDSNTDQGSTYVFVKPAGGWSGALTEAAKLTASDGAAGDLFGRVAVSDDTIVVGAVLDSIGVNFGQGSAYVFVKPAGGWSGALTENAKLTASDGAVLDLFGQSVSVSGDTIVVGAVLDNIGVNLDQGSAYVFVKPAGGWSGALTEDAKLTASDGAAFDGFGGSVSVSGDTIVAGASSDDIGSNGDQGSVYVFVKPAGGWSGALTEDAKLTASDGAAIDSFGGSVSVSGNAVVIGASGDDIGSNANQGSAYVFLGPSTTPVPATLVLTPATADNPVGTSHTVTARVEDANAQPVEGMIVRFTVTGSVTTSGQCTTDANGQCDFIYQGPTAPGEDSISAFVDTDGDSVQDTGEPAGSATKRWVNRPPVADAGADQTIACATPDGILVTLNGSGSSDPDGDTLSYQWRDANGNIVGTDAVVNVAVPLGKHTFTLTVSDGKGGTASDSVTVNVLVGVEGLLPPMTALALQGETVPFPDKAFRAGRTLPLRLRMFCGATVLTDAEVAPPQIVALTRSGDPIDLSTVDLDAGESNDSGVLFRYSGPNWVFNLKTSDSPGTYVITIETPDARRYNAAFVLR